MVNSMKSTIQTSRTGAAGGRQSPPKDSKLSKEVIFVRAAPRARPRPPPGPGPQPASPRLTDTTAPPRSSREADIEEEADDVIDLGAPRRLRREPSGRLLPAPRAPARRALLPNPRLYPGPKPKPKPRSRRPEAARARRGKRTLRRPVPNSRLYRPGPPRPPAPPPPPARPRAAWPPPAPPRALDTASRAALRLGARAASPRAPPCAPAPPPPPARASSPAAAERARRLVVTLPAAAARYRPASEHFRARAAPDGGGGSGASTPPAARLRPRPGAMEPPRGRSSSPEDRSEGNETLSAPSEFLAEFLSAIMRRQYAEALKYCRLILQYEPHNATARGFYPLLRTKVARAQRTEAAAAAAEGAGSSSDEADAGAGRSSAGDSPSRQEEQSERSERGSEASAGGEQSELELDSSDALQSSPSLSLSRRTERTDSASASAGCWDSSASGERSEPGAADDNGNAAAAPAPPLLPDDLENDNTTDAGAGSGEPHHGTHLKGAGEALSPLQRLRAQFACSIK